MLRHPRVRALLLLAHLLRWAGEGLRGAGFAVAGYAIKPDYWEQRGRR